jgi:predicted membrane-bound mannosyltransferase
MDWSVVGYVFFLAVMAAIGIMVGRLYGLLVSIHKELVRIRLATASLHDRIVPDILTRQALRKLGGK